MLTLESIKDKLIPLLQEKQVQKAIIFGSLARGTATRRSDIDLLLVVDTNKRWFKRFEDFLALYELFPKHQVELFIYTPEELERISRRPFIQTILREGVVLFER